MSGEPRFSLVIPTRNRTDTLKHTLDTCLGQREFDDFEIVIHDNSADYKTQHYISKLKAADPRAAATIKYEQRSSSCSMARCFEEAIGRAVGEFVIVLGDDDGLVPMALKELDALITRTMTAVITWRPALYGWPSMALARERNYLGFCTLRAFDLFDGRTSLVSAIDALSLDKLPSLYANTAVRRSVIEALKDGEGRLIRSRAPWAYSAVVLSYFCGQYIETTVPFTLSGFSGFSHRVALAMGGDNPLPRTDARVLNTQDHIALHVLAPDLPVYPAVDIADSFMWAKTIYFSDDGTLNLPRRKLVETCAARADLSSPKAGHALLLATHDDLELQQYARALIAHPPARTPQPTSALHPVEKERGWLDLDAAGFGVQTVKDAADLVHKLVWPGDAPLRYDLQ